MLNNKILLPTENVKKIHAALKKAFASEEQEILGIFGNNGLGKTIAIQSFKAGRSDVVIVRLRENMTPTWLMRALFIELRMADKYGELKQLQAYYSIVSMIEAELMQKRRMIILDEVNKADKQVIEVMRDLSDVTLCPVVYVGDNTALPKMKPNKSLFDRIQDNLILLDELTEEDMRLITRSFAKGLSFSDDAIKHLHSIASGSFRRAKNIVRRLSYYAKVNGQTNVDESMIVKALKNGVSYEKVLPERV